MKIKKFIIAVMTLLLGGGGVVAYQSFGAGFTMSSNITLLASSSNLASLPNSAVFANNTTTDAGGTVDDGGFLVNQLVRTEGIDRVNLVVNGRGRTATSTMFIRQMGSVDGTNFYDLATSTSMITSTSTLWNGVPRGISLDFGTVTTTRSIQFDVHGDTWTRFVMWGENLAADGTDGAEAWVTATLIEDNAR